MERNGRVGKQSEREKVKEMVLTAFDLSRQTCRPEEIVSRRLREWHSQEMYQAVLNGVAHRETKLQPKGREGSDRDEEARNLSSFRAGAVGFLITQAPSALLDGRATEAG